MDNKIKNEKIEVETGILLNDKDYMNMCLSKLKELEKNMTICLSEASCEELYQQYFNIFSEISKLQREAYEMMFIRGWYTLEKEENNKIEEKLTCLEKELHELS